MKGSITTLFVDIGGVILSNGWDHASRDLAAKTFQLDKKEMESRHSLIFSTYELGKISLDEYLSRVIFYEPRSFTRTQFQTFMFDQSIAYPEMIDFVRQLKSRHHLKVVVVSNEGRELNAYRIKKFQLNTFVDIFVSSSYVHLSKPDTAIYRLALDISEATSEEVAYIDDRLLFVEVAESLGISGIHHLDVETTRAKLDSYGLN
jgi:putative hydrolase of the HAD superfamily